MQPSDPYSTPQPSQPPYGPTGPYAAPPSAQAPYSPYPVQTATLPPAASAVPTISRLQMRIYFSSFPYWAIGLATLGLFGLFLGGTTIVAGLLAAAVGVGWIILRSTLSISDASYDAWVKGQLHVSQDYALKQLFIDRSQLLGQEAFTVQGFVTPNALNEEPYKSSYDPSEVRIRRGADGKYRFSINTMTHIFPLEHEMAAFTGAVSALNPDTRYEIGATYFYDDITGILTERKENRVKFSLASLPLLLAEPAANIALSLLIFPPLLIPIFGTLALRFGPFSYTPNNTLALLFVSLAGLVGVVYPFIVLGVLIWFLFFRQRNLQSQEFALDIASGSRFGAYIGFISRPRRSVGSSNVEDITTFATDFPQTIERIRFLLRSAKQK